MLKNLLIVSAILAAPSIANADSGRATPPSVTLVCHTRSEDGLSATETITVDFARRTADGYPANLSENFINFTRTGVTNEGAKYNNTVSINRVTGRWDSHLLLYVGTPAVSSSNWVGNCSPQQRAF
jgi:hypothetical protein